MDLPVRARVHHREISTNLAQLNFWLLGWPVSLAFVPFFARNGRAWALAAVPIITLIGYSIVGVPTVAAVGPTYYCRDDRASGHPDRERSAAGDRAGPRSSGVDLSDARADRHPARATLASLLAFVPFQAAPLGLMADVTQAPYELVESRGLDKAVVFVHSLPALSVVPGSWAEYHRNNSPDLSDRVLFLRDRGPRRTEN